LLAPLDAAAFSGVTGILSTATDHACRAGAAGAAAQDETRKAAGSRSYRCRAALDLLSCRAFPDNAVRLQQFALASELAKLPAQPRAAR
jgi:hypothetical protein